MSAVTIQRVWRGLGSGAALVAVLVVGAPSAAPANAPLLRLTVADTRATEGTKAVFAVRLSKPAATKLRVRFKTRNGTATAGKDYRALTGTVVFKRGQKQRPVAVAVLNDAAVEALERFSLRLTAPRGTKLKRGTAVATITDDDVPSSNPPPPPPPPGPPPPPTGPAMSINDVTMAEGSSGQTGTTFTASLAFSTSKQVTATFATMDVSATAGSDYTATTGTVTFAPGEKTKPIVVQVLGDIVDEDDETFEVRLTNAVNATLSDDRGTGTITDDDAAIADVGVTLTDSPDPVIAGAPLTYTATITNGGSDRAPATTLIDDLPASLTYVSATPSSGSCSFAAPRITCALGMIPNGATRTVTIAVEATVGGGVSNTVSVSGAYSDPSSANDSATESTTTQSGADVELDLTSSAATMLAGQQLTYTMSVHNRGPFAAQDPVLTQTLPVEVSFVSATGGCSESSGTVTCGAAALGATMASGTTVPLQVVVARSVPVAATFSSSASVATSSPADPDPSDNSDSVGTTYLPAGDVAVTVQRSATTVDVGDDLSWTITVQNNGPNDTASVTLHETVPSGFTLESVTPSAGSCTPSAGAVDCSFGTMSSGASATIVLAGRPAAGTSGVTLTSTGTASSPSADPVPANNTSSSPVKVQPKLVINDVTVNEPKGLKPVAGGPQTTFAIFTLTLTRASSQTITVDFTTADGTAMAGMDYTATSGQITFTAGETQKTLMVTVRSDGFVNEVEPNETYFVNLTNAVNVTLADAQGLGTILE